MEMFCDARHTTRRYGRYIDDVRRLFVFHGLSCGNVENFDALASKLTQNKAFRTDVSALARNICELEDGRIPASEMLTIIALASGGEELVAEEHADQIATSRTAGMILMLLAEACAWGKSNQTETPVSQPAEGSQDQSSTGGEHRDALDQLRGQTAPDTDFIASTARTSHTQAEPYSCLTRDQHDDRSNAADLLPAPSLIGRQAAVPVSQTRLRSEGVIARGMDAAAAERNGAREVALTSSQVALMPQWEAAQDSPLAFAQNSSEATDLPSTQERFSTEFRTPPSPSDPGAPRAETSLHSHDAPSSVALLQETVPLTTAPTAVVRDGQSRPHYPELPSLEARAEHHGSVAVPITEQVAHEQGPTSTRKVLGKLSAVAAVLLGLLGIYGVRVSTRHPSNISEQVGEGSPSKSSMPTDQSAGKAVADSPPQKLTQGSEAGGISNTASVTVPGTNASRTTSRSPVSEKKAVSRPASVISPGKTLPKRRIVAKPSDIAKVDTLEKSSPALKARTTSPAEHSPITVAASGTSVAKERPLVVPSSAMKAILISAREPVYPPEALRQHLEGTVVLNAFIARDGTVRRMDVVEGPSVFVKSAVAATSWRRYKPYLVHGKPVEVETQITVKYPAH